MKLSGAVEQACCIMAILADPQRKAPITNDALAEKMAVSPTYLKKISRKLVVARLITSTQGAGGGLSGLPAARARSLRAHGQTRKGAGRAQAEDDEDG